MNKLIEKFKSKLIHDKKVVVTYIYTDRGSGRTSLSWSKVPDKDRLLVERWIAKDYLTYLFYEKDK